MAYAVTTMEVSGDIHDACGHNSGLPPLEVRPCGAGFQLRAGPGCDVPGVPLCTYGAEWRQTYNDDFDNARVYDYDPESGRVNIVGETLLDYAAFETVDIIATPLKFDLLRSSYHEFFFVDFGGLLILFVVFLMFLPFRSSTSSLLFAFDLFCNDVSLSCFSGEPYMNFIIYLPRDTSTDVFSKMKSAFENYILHQININELTERALRISSIIMVSWNTIHIMVYARETTVTTQPRPHEVKINIFLNIVPKMLLIKYA